MAIDPRRIEVIDDRTATILRGMSAAERLERANTMVLQAREVLRAVVQGAHPTWGRDAVEREVSRRMTGGAA